MASLRLIDGKIIMLETIGHEMVSSLNDNDVKFELSNRVWCSAINYQNMPSL